MEASVVVAVPREDRVMEVEAPAVSIAGVSKRYGRAWALRDVDLEIGRGERVLVVGENGSGKSTLLRVLATATRATRGTAHVAGFSSSSEPEEIRRRVAFLPDRPALYGALTPFENVDFSCRMRGVDAPPLAIRAALEHVDLTRVADDPAHTLSRGMTQRVALAGALLRRTEVVLLDEPYTALDTAGVAWVDQWLEQLRDAGVTVIVATHLLTARARAGARVETLRGGRLDEQRAPMQASRAAPRAIQLDARARPRESRENADWRRAALIAHKDLRIERRAGAALGAMICFAAVVLLLFGFALGPGAGLRDASAGLAWVTLLLAAVLSLDRASQLECESGGWDAFRVAPGARWPIYAGKVAACTALLGIVELVLLPCAIVLYDLAVPPPSVLAALAGIALLATFGIVALGVLYALLTANLRARQVLLPLLLFPMMIPVLLAAVKATGLLLFGDPMHELAAWAKLLGAADLVYATIGVFTFGVLLDE
jgi:heme exporter protein B